MCIETKQPNISDVIFHAHVTTIAPIDNSHSLYLCGRCSPKKEHYSNITVVYCGKTGKLKSVSII